MYSVGLSENLYKKSPLIYIYSFGNVKKIVCLCSVPERKIQGTVKVLYMYKHFVRSYAFLNVKIQRSRNHFGVALLAKEASLWLCSQLQILQYCSHALFGNFNITV